MECEDVKSDYGIMRYNIKDWGWASSHYFHEHSDKCIYFLESTKDTEALQRLHVIIYL